MIKKRNDYTLTDECTAVFTWNRTFAILRSKIALFPRAWPIVRVLPRHWSIIRGGVTLCAGCARACPVFGSDKGKDLCGHAQFLLRDVPENARAHPLSKTWLPPWLHKYTLTYQINEYTRLVFSIFFPRYSLFFHCTRLYFSNIFLCTRLL